MSSSKTVMLTPLQKACLEALKKGFQKKTTIAIEIKTDFKSLSRDLEFLREEGLVQQDQKRNWSPTLKGRSCSIKCVIRKTRKGTDKPGHGGLRLLGILAFPMRGSEIAKRLNVSRQAIHSLVIKLHARGFITLADPDNPLSYIKRAEDPTLLLTWHQARVLSVVPEEYGAEISSISLRIKSRMDRKNLKAGSK